MITHVKVFKKEHLIELQDEVNEFLHKFNNSSPLEKDYTKIVSIQYSSKHSALYSEYSALIVLGKD